MGIRFEYRSKSSSKFWEPTLKSSVLTVRFGKIGTSGQIHNKTFTSPEKAKDEYRKLVCEKLTKGYKPAISCRPNLVPATQVSSPKVVCHDSCGHIVFEEFLNDICAWLTACVQYGVTPKQFERTWEKLVEDEDEELTESLGKIHKKIPKHESEFWADNLQECFFEILYKKAVKDGADRFIWATGDGDYEILALRGDPGARAIELACYGKKDTRKAKCNNNWPDELRPGAPIAHLNWNGSATLCDGKEIDALDD